MCICRAIWLDEGAARDAAHVFAAEEYLEKIAMMRGASRPIAITTDIIVGFPGETESDFEQTLSLLDEVRYDNLVFLQVFTAAEHAVPSRRGCDSSEEKGRRLGGAPRQTARDSNAKARNAAGWKDVWRCWSAEIAAREHTSGLGINVAPRAKFCFPAQELLGTYVHVHVTGAGPNNLVGEQIL